MNPWLQALISNIAIASVLAVVAAVAPRRGASPALTYALWLLVLIKLVTPPIWRLPVDASLWVEGSGAAARSEEFYRAVRESAAASTESSEDHAWASTEERVRGDLESVGAELLALAAELDWPEAGFSESEAVGPGDIREIQSTSAGVSTAEPLEVSEAEPEDVGGAWVRPRLSTRDVVLTVWAAVAAILGLLAVSRIYRFRKRVFERAAISDVLTDEARLVAREMGLRSDPVVYVVNASIPPALWPGLRRATMVCPMTLLGEMTASERAGLFAHELAHFARRDTWRRYFETAVVTLYWWFPIAWIARRNLQQLEERLCDSWALDRAKRPAADYAQALLKTMNFLSRGTTATPSTACGFGDKNRKTIMYRFKAILTNRENAKLSAKQWVAVLAIAGLTGPISGVTPVSRAQETNEGGSNVAAEPAATAAEEPTTALSQASAAESLSAPSAEPSPEPIGTNLEAAEPEDPFGPPIEPTAPGISEAPEPSADPFEEPNDLFGAASDVSVEQTQHKQQTRIRQLEARLAETQARLQALTRETEERLMLKERELAATLDQMLAQLEQALTEQAQQAQDLLPPSVPPPLKNLPLESPEIAAEKHEIEARLAKVAAQLERVESERGENNPQAQRLRQERLALEQAKAALEQRWAEMEQARLKAYADQARARWQDQLERRENPQDTMSDEEPDEKLFEVFEALNESPKNLPRLNASKIEKFLREFYIDELSCKEAPLGEVIRRLHQSIRDADPERRGVNFIINAPIINPNAPSYDEFGVPVARSPFEGYPGDLRGVAITIDPPIREISAYDALREITKVAESPIRFLIEDYGVMITAGQDPQKKQRYTRTYRLDPDAFESVLEELDASQSIQNESKQDSSQYIKPLRLQEDIPSRSNREEGGIEDAVNELFEAPDPELDSVGRESTQARASQSRYRVGGTRFVESTSDVVGVQDIVRRFFLSDAGVDMMPPNSVFFNDRNGTLLLRATREELSRVEESIQRLIGRKDEEPADSAAVQPETSATEIEKMLRETYIDGLSYKQAPLSKVIWDLIQEMREMDAEWRDVNFAIESRIDQEDGSFRVAQPVLMEQYPHNFSGVTVTVDPPISEISAYDALREITKVADSPIYFSIEDYGVVIRPGEDPELKRYTRTYSLAPEVFEATLKEFIEAQSGESERLSLQDAVRQFFAKFGLSLLPPNNIFYNNRNGTLLIRATAEELQGAEQAIRVLNEKSVLLGPAPEEPWQRIDMSRYDEFGFDPVTEDSFARMPSDFAFEYNGEPQPGTRSWERVDDRTWVERYPGGLESRFRIIGRTTVEGRDGTVAVKYTGAPKSTNGDNDGGQLVFIPDIGDGNMKFYYMKVSRGDTEWSELADIGFSLAQADSRNRNVNQNANTYQAQVGDTLVSIAKKYGIDIGELVEQNELKNPVLKVGQELQIPAPKGALRLELAQHGNLRLDGELVTRDVLGSLLEIHKDANPETTKVLIVASPTTRLDELTSVFSTCQELGIPFEVQAKAEPAEVEGPELDEDSSF